MVAQSGADEIIVQNLIADSKIALDPMHRLLAHLASHPRAL